MTVNLKAHVSLARMSARGMLAYKSMIIFGTFTVLFQTLALLSVWRVLLRDGTAVDGFTWDQMKVYLLIAYIGRSLVSETSDFRMVDRIREGTVALDLVKPVNYQAARFSETIGAVAVEAGLIAVVLGAAAILTGGFFVPSLGQLALFAMSVAAIVPLNFLITYMVGLLAFWTHNFMGIQWARDALVALFAGAIVPLSFLPQSFENVARLLPFAGLVATPADIYLGRSTGSDALGLIGLQVAWIVVLWLLGQAFFDRAVRRLTVHGG